MNRLALHYFPDAPFNPTTYDAWKKDAVEKASNDGLIIKDKDVWWTLDEDIVSAAVKQNPIAIKYAPKFQDNERIGRIAVKANGLAINWLSLRLQQMEEIKQLAKNNPPLSYTPSLDSPTIFFAKDSNSPINSLFKIENQILQKIRVFPLENDEASHFVRDSRVTLEKGHLIPYSIEHIITFSGTVKALMPPTAHHFIIGKKEIRTKPLRGRGLYSCNVEQALINSYEFGIPFKRGKTCIEGGNCFLFMSNGVKKAIIGELSIIYTMQGLEDSGYFKTLLPIADEPSLESLRMARNLDLHSRIKKEIEEKAFENKQHQSAKTSDNNSGPKHIIAWTREDEFNYRKQLIAPVSDQEKDPYRKNAQLIEARLNQTKACIAEELELSLENIAFIPQKRFHIDMDLFVTPWGEVGLHDDAENLKFLRKLAHKHTFDKKEKKLWDQYFKKSTKYAKRFQSIHEKTIEILRAHNIRFQLLPSVFRAKKTELNYCNGIFIKKINEPNTAGFSSPKIMFVTTGPSTDEEKIFHRHFLILFRRSFPRLEIRPIPKVSRFITKLAGGVHCLTTESSILVDT